MLFRRLHRAVKRSKNFAFEYAFVRSNSLLQEFLVSQNAYLRSEMFADVVNRASIKLAEIDAITGICRNDKLLYADLCCAPGGFLNYIQ